MEDGDKKQPSIVLKHYCKVCKRGFGCAGALGGHMRSHGVGGADARLHPNHHEDNNKFISDLSCNMSNQDNRHSYFLRKVNRTYRASHGDRNKERPSIGPANGGHQRGKCSLDETLMLPGASYEAEVGILGNAYKRRKSEKCDHSSEEEEDLTNCLVMLSNKSYVFNDKEENKAKDVMKGMFQCKACKKVFSSHQALGGHRASHKKVKGCYAARFNNIINEDDNNVEEDLINQDEFFMPSDSSELIDLDNSSNLQTNNSSISKGKSKEHECSICHRIFSSGQALGGHKRCHWLTTNLPDNTLIQTLHDQFSFDHHSPSFIFNKPVIRKSEINLDLNSPPVLKFFDSDGKMGSTDIQIQQNLTCTDRTTKTTTPIFDYEAPARIFLNLWVGEGIDNIGINHNQKEVKSDSLHDSKNDEESKVKELGKFSDLKVMKLERGSSNWLQVGIASTTLK